MLHRPTLLARYDARIIPDEGVLLVSDRREHVLSGAVYADLVPLLTGMLTTDEIVDRVPHHPAETYYALMGLTDQGIVVEAGGVPPATTSTSVPTARRAARVRANVAMKVVGHIPHAACVEALVRQGFAPCEDLAPTAATIVFVDDYLRPEARLQPPRRRFPPSNREGCAAAARACGPCTQMRDRRPPAGSVLQRASGDHTRGRRAHV